MSKAVEKLLDVEADKQALIDEITEDREEVFRNRYLQLLNDVGARDPDLWSEFVGDIEVTEEDYMNVPVFNRDHEWHMGFLAMIAAVRQQAWLEIFATDVIAIAENEGRKVEKQVNNMTKAQLQEAAVKGVGKQRFADASTRRRAAR